MKKLEHTTSARREFRSYLVLAFGLFFTWAGATTDPATNCDKSGRECAPWLVPIAFGMGLVATSAGLGLLVGNRRRGSRLELAQRRLVWWDSTVSPGTHRLLLDDVARILVQVHDESDDAIFFYGRDATLLPSLSEGDLPYACAAWARDLAAHFPHIAVDVA
jgi:hypothetical protein